MTSDVANQWLFAPVVGSASDRFLMATAIDDAMVCIILIYTITSVRKQAAS